MSGRVYSTSFVQKQAYSGLGSYEVPEGYTCVVRDARCYINAPLTEQVTAWLGNDVGGKFDWWVVDLDTTVLHIFEGRQVFPEGQTWYFYASDSADWTISGYLLENP